MENARFWIGAVAADHIRRAVAEGVCAFSHGKQAAVAKLRPGDRIAFYSPKSGLGESDTVQAFTAIGTVTAWVRDAAYLAQAIQAPVRPLLEPISFVKSPRNSGMGVSPDG